MTMRKKLGQIIQNRRKKLGLTQREVATAIGIKSPNYISMIEKDGEVPPGRAVALARALRWDEGLFARIVLVITYPELKDHVPLKM